MQGKSLGAQRDLTVLRKLVRKNWHMAIHVDEVHKDNHYWDNLWGIAITC